MDPDYFMSYRPTLYEMPSFDIPVSLLPDAHELTDWSRVPLSETDVADLLKFPALCDTRKLITVFTRHLPLDPGMSHMSPIHFYHAISQRTSSLLFLRQYLRDKCGFSPSGIPTKIVYAYVCLPCLFQVLPL
jgi:hypothetical protein